MGIKLDAFGSVQASLFEKFAETLVYWHHGKVGIKEFREYLSTYVGGSIDEKSIANWFVRHVPEISIDEWRFKEFCKAFETKFQNLSGDQKKMFAETKISFDSWKASVYSSKHILPYQRNYDDEDVLYIRQKLSDTTWYTYTLTENFNEPKIERGVIKFGRNPLAKNSLSFKMTPELNTCYGTAVYTKNGCLSISFNDDNFDNRYLHLIINYRIDKQVSILVGVKTDIASRICSNFIVLDLYSGTTDLEAGNFKINTPLIPEEIIKLLLVNRVRPINFPSRGVTNKKRVEDFLIDYNSWEDKFPLNYPTSSNL